MIKHRSLFLADLKGDIHQMGRGTVVGIDLLVVMATPTIQGTWLGVLQRGDQIETFEQNKIWIRIKFLDVEGYVRKAFVEEIK